MNALSVAMNAEQDSTVQALKLQLLQQQLAVERARMTAEDARGDNERARASAARTRVILDTTFDAIAARTAGTPNGLLVLLKIATGGLMAASRTVQR